MEATIPNFLFKKNEMKENEKMFLLYINIDSKCLNIDI